MEPAVNLQWSLRARRGGRRQCIVAAEDAQGGTPESMRHRHGAGWAIAPLIVLGAAVWMPRAAAADIDACTLLSAREVSAALTVAVGEGEHIVPHPLTSCGWLEPGSASIGSKKVVLSLMNARSFRTGKTPVKGVTETSVPDLGDEAYYVSMPPFGTALSVRKGTTYFQLRIAGFPAAQVRHLERELALRLLERV
jgi:hypothetical protein